MNNEKKMPESLARFIATAVRQTIERMDEERKFEINSMEEKALIFYLQQCDFNKVVSWIATRANDVKNYPPIPSN